MRVLMLAPPGGGKGTQGERVAAALGVVHISSGDLLRAAVAEDTPIGREVGGHLAAGRLAPDDLVTRAVVPMLAAHDGYVLDGFPRTLAQAAHVGFDRAIYLAVPTDVLTERLLARGRTDDTLDVIERRLREYAADTRPLIEHYRDQGILLETDGDRAADAITADILDRLQN